MYAAFDDPYCYPGTVTLKNKLGIRDPAALAAFEAEIVLQRALEPLPEGRLNVGQLKAVHRHLFQDVYPWAGRYRTVRISKDNSTFCYPEHIAPTLATLFSWLKERNYLRALDPEGFASQSAHFLSELNAIHAFREGNGRTQLTFMGLLAERAGHPLAFQRLEPQPFLDAMICGFRGNEQPLAFQMRLLIDPA